MAKFRSIKHSVKYAMVFTGITILSVFGLKRTCNSTEPITKPYAIATEYNICPPDTNYSPMMNNIKMEKILDSIHYEELNAPTSQKYKTSTKPYRVKGKTYYPMETVYEFVETGSASWYGPNFNGKKTASGEIYNQHEHTAAHKTLPFGTRVKVENLDNNTSTIVVINDRGPFASGRIIDLSYSAAKDLNIDKKGVAHVKLTVINDQQPIIAPAQENLEYASLNNNRDSIKRLYFNRMQERR